MALEVAGSKPVTRPISSRILGGIVCIGLSKMAWGTTLKKQMIKCGRGGIGRRAGFRYQ